MERFETLGEELERLVVHGRETTVLERRALAPGAGHDLDDDDAIATPDGWGLCLDEDGEPLDRAALRAAAVRVVAVPVDLGPAPTGSSLDDALLLGPTIGRLCVAAGDPLAGDRPPRAALDAVAALAAVALTIAAAGSGAACAAELDYERAWRLTQAVAHAGRETLWARPGDADWPEWLMDVLACAAAVVECCAACLHRPPAPLASLHAEHFCTADEELDHTAGRLVATALQALVLFADN